MIDDLDWTPRPSTSCTPILCIVCGKEGRVDRERGAVIGAKMPLVDFLAGQPRVCMKCRKAQK